jgi:hypothetical protein
MSRAIRWQVVPKGPIGVARCIVADALRAIVYPSVDRATQQQEGLTAPRVLVSLVSHFHQSNTSRRDL